MHRLTRQQIEQVEAVILVGLVLTILIFPEIRHFYFPPQVTSTVTYQVPAPRSVQEDPSPYVSVYGVQKAQELCREYGGIQTLEGLVPNTVYYKCMDGREGTF
jgi:hypothetical protein